MDQLDIYPMPNKEDVKKLFLGKYLKQLPAASTMHLAYSC